MQKKWTTAVGIFILLDSVWGFNEKKSFCDCQNKWTTAVGLFIKLGSFWDFKGRSYRHCVVDIDSISWFNITYVDNNYWNKFV